MRDRALGFRCGCRFLYVLARGGALFRGGHFLPAISLSFCGSERLSSLPVNDRPRSAFSPPHAPGAITRDGKQPSAAGVSVPASPHASVSAKLSCRSVPFLARASPVFWCARMFCLSSAVAALRRRDVLWRGQSRSPVWPKPPHVSLPECAPSLRGQIHPPGWKAPCPPLCPCAPVLLFLLLAYREFAARSYFGCE
jgi:hypothetical protein